MTEPNTVNKALVIPNTGDLPGAWGTSALNPDFQAIDGMLGGFATISLSSATTRLLGLPNQILSGGSLTPGAGPSESQNFLLKFTGTLSGNAILQFTLPGYYAIDNRCTVGSFYIKLSPASGTGNAIGAPPGQKVFVSFDGTDLDYINLGIVGSALDLHGVSSLPAWMTACTVSPYLIKDGSTYSTATYPALAAMLGSTFGGNGITTFAVPDERSRVRIGLDTLSVSSSTYAARVTLAGSGITGTTMGVAGGDQLLQQHSHTYVDPGHVHTSTLAANSGGANFAVRGDSTASAGVQTTGTATIGITISTSGGGSGQNMQPTIVSFLPLIKT